MILCVFHFRLEEVVIRLEVGWMLFYIIILVAIIHR